MDDPTFQTKSPTSVNARIGADHLHRWCSNGENYACLQKFMEDLLGDLNGALVNPSGKVLHRDKLWESYFYVRSKETFINRWTVFLCTTNSPAGSPVLYQHLTDLVFKALLHSKYSVMVNDKENISTTPLTYNEVNALRYTAGYVCRHIRKKIEASSHPLREEMVLSLMTMVKEKSDTTSGPCEEWTDLVDWDGLWHIRENTHSFFLCLEEVRVHLQSLLTKTNKKKKLSKTSLKMKMYNSIG